MPHFLESDQYRKKPVREQSDCRICHTPITHNSMPRHIYRQIKKLK